MHFLFHSKENRKTTERESQVTSPRQDTRSNTHYKVQKSDKARDVHLIWLAVKKKIIINTKAKHKVE